MVLCMRNKKNINCDNIQSNIQMCNVKSVSKVKLLGVQLDDKFNWKSHGVYDSSNNSKVIGTLKR